MKKANINLWKEKTVESSKLLKEINKGYKTVEEIEKSKFENEKMYSEKL